MNERTDLVQRRRSPTSTEHKTAEEELRNPLPHLPPGEEDSNNASSPRNSSSFSLENNLVRWYRLYTKCLSSPSFQTRLWCVLTTLVTVWILLLLLQQVWWYLYTPQPTAVYLHPSHPLYRPQHEHALYQPLGQQHALYQTHPYHGQQAPIATANVNDNLWTVHERFQPAAVPSSSAENASETKKLPDWLVEDDPAAPAVSFPWKRTEPFPTPLAASNGGQQQPYHLKGQHAVDNANGAPMIVFNDYESALEWQVATRPDYGGLLLVSLHQHQASSRLILPDDYDRYEQYRGWWLATMDAAQVKEKSQYWHDDEFGGKRQCYRNNWSMKRSFPNCNTVHEVHMDVPLVSDSSSIPTLLQAASTIQDTDVQYRGSGYFLDVWMLEHQQQQQEEESVVAFKKFRMRHDVDYDALYKTVREAVILDQLSSSERILNLYGMCGVTTLTEAAVRDATKVIMPHNEGEMTQVELNEMQQAAGDVVPMNNLTLTEKVDMAIVMSEALADIHGFEGGVVAHGDVYTDQWLQTADGRWVLNDLNTAEILEWDPWNEQYCYLPRHDGCHKNWNRPPETLKCGGVSEAMDVWEFGNNIYALLTGLWVFHNDYKTHEKEVMELVKQGGRAYIDPRYRTRSVVEGTLVEIMEDCWEYDDTKRISIFEVIRRLRELKEQMMT